MHPNLIQKIKRNIQRIEKTSGNQTAHKCHIYPFIVHTHTLYINCIDHSLMEVLCLNKWPIKAFTHRISLSWYNHMRRCITTKQCTSLHPEKRSKMNESSAVAPLLLLPPPHDPQQLWTRNTLQTEGRNSSHFTNKFFL